MKVLTLHVHAPFFRVETEGLQRSLLTEALRLIDELIASVVPSSRIPLGVFIW